MKEKTKTRRHPFLFFLLVPLIINPLSGANPSEIPKYAFFLLLLIIVAAYNLIKNTRPRENLIKGNRQITVLILLFILSAAVSTIFSISPHESFFGNYMSLKGLVEIITWAVFFFYALTYAREEDNRRDLLLGIEAVGIICALYGLMQKLTMDYTTIFSAGQMFAGRINSFFSNPNDFGQYLIFPFFATIANLADKKNRRKKIVYLHAFSIIIIAISTLLTANRASILAIICGLFIIVLLNIKKIITRIIVSVIFLGTVISAMAVFFISTRSIISRLILWSSALKMSFLKPFFGFGPETFHTAIQPFLQPEIYNQEQFLALPSHPHNEIIALYLNQGIFGLAVIIILFTIIIAAALTSIRQKKHQPGIQKYALATIIATAVTAQFSYLQITHILLFLISAAIIVSTSLPQNLSLKPGWLKYPATFLLVIFCSWLGSKLIVSDHLLGTAMGHSISAPKTAQIEFETVFAVNDFFSYPYEAAFTLMQRDFFHNPDLRQTYLDRLERYGQITNYNYQYYSYLGMFDYAAGKKEQAIKAFSTAEELAPYASRVCSDFLSAAKDGGDIVNAKAAAQRCWELLPALIKQKDLKPLPPEVTEHDLEIYLKSNPVYFEIMGAMNS